MLALNGEAPLWQVWWMGGIVTVMLATWLGLSAEDFRQEEAHFIGAMLDSAKFLCCLLWFVTAWRCADNVGKRVWTGLSRGTIVAGIAVLAFTF